MIKYKDIEFSTIYSQEIIKNKLEKIVSDSSMFDGTNRKKRFSGYVNLYNFEIHNKQSVLIYRTINYWKIFFKGTMANNNNLTNVKIRTRVFHGEIIYMYLFFFFFLIVSMPIKTIVLITFFGAIFFIITLYTVIKIKNIDKVIAHYERYIVKTIIE